MKKKQAGEIREQIAKLDAGIELLEKEILACQKQIEGLMKQKAQLEEEVPEERRGFFAKIFCWFKKMFSRKRLRREAEQKREEILKTEEKLTFLRELIGEKESQREEFILEKDSFYEKLHEQSKNLEVKAIELAMDRIREISALRKEEVMQQLLDKTSAVLLQMTKGKYQKLILEENEEPVVWDGNQTVKLFQLSTGCVDQVYLALRIGLQDLFFEEDTLPLLFDDAFVYFDDKRLERLLVYLQSLGRQVLLFSCHKRELRILEKHQIPYGKILL